MQLQLIDYLILATFAFVVDFGFLPRPLRSSGEFPRPGRSVPPQIAGPAFFAALPGEQAIAREAASGAKPGAGS